MYPMTLTNDSGRVYEEICSTSGHRCHTCSTAILFQATAGLTSDSNFTDRSVEPYVTTGLRKGDVTHRK